MSKYNKIFKVKFRGVRGSHPVCSQNQMKYGGNTSCVEVLANDRTIILDGGTGIINLGNDLVRTHIASGTAPENRQPIGAIILFSHSHMDHTQGLPFFKPVYIKSSNINIFGSRSRNRDFEKILSETIFDLIFPVELQEMSANISINNIHETDAIIIEPDSEKPRIVRANSTIDPKFPDETIVITCMKSSAHPKDGVMIYKISCNGKSLVYATDKESYIGGDSRFTTFARNADLVIHDAQYTMEDYVSPIAPKQGYGHSTPEMAIEAMRLANAGQLVLFHLDPGYDDETLKKMEEKARSAFPNTTMAYEGLEIDLMQVKNRK